MAAVGDATIDGFVNPLYGDLHLSIGAPLSVASAATWSRAIRCWDHS